MWPCIDPLREASIVSPELVCPPHWEKKNSKSKRQKEKKTLHRAASLFLFCSRKNRLNEVSTVVFKMTKSSFCFVLFFLSVPPIPLSFSFSLFSLPPPFVHLCHRFHFTTALFTSSSSIASHTLPVVYNIYKNPRRFWTEHLTLVFPWYRVFI